MHPGDHSGHVIDLGIELPTVQLPTQVPLTSIKNEMHEPQIMSTNTNKVQTVNDYGHPFYQQVFFYRR